GSLAASSWRPGLRLPSSGRYGRRSTRRGSRAIWKPTRGVPWPPAWPSSWTTPAGDEGRLRLVRRRARPARVLAGPALPGGPRRARRGAEPGVLREAGALARRGGADEPCRTPGAPRHPLAAPGLPQAPAPARHRVGPPGRRAGGPAGG